MRWPISLILSTCFLLIIISTVSCVDMSQKEPAMIEVPASQVTFLLIDNSLSYNNPKEADSRRVMEQVNREIVNRINKAQPGQRILVRTIQSDSNEISAIITQLNLDHESLYFMKPKPSNPIELRVWEREKREFEATLTTLIQPRKEQAIKELQERGSQVLSAPTKTTDFIGALLSCQRYFDKQPHDRKKLIVYSDMEESADLEDASNLNLTGVDIEARYVTRPATDGNRNTHRYFKDLETNWRNKLRAQHFELYEVQNSFMNDE